MRLASIYLLRQRGKDDVIDFYKDLVEPDKVRVDFADNWTFGRRHQTSFYLKNEDAKVYIRNLLKSLSQDIDPYHEIQIMPLTSPSILYYVADLSDNEIRNNIEHSLMMSILLCVQSGRYIVNLNNNG